eukprot:TRINITY_DN41095_c0_g1_i1.p1 TRINITY_DN41095_c0_g1~~TRINITY_DN41095_c0_g1_i1.p1  ORF type:complete len:794 (-),score=182.13 TRINITY_DN41095_c0_g1_i1:20-2401(-)
MDVEDVRAKQNQKFRGKLYALSEDTWKDAGTGHTSVTGSGKDRRLVFIDEQSGETLHDRPIFAAEVYQLQGEGEKKTIIVWEDEEEAKDWALSFQDPDGTSEIFELICNDPDIADSRRILPLPKFGNLQELSRKLSFVPPSQRETLAGELMSQKFVDELLETFHSAEDLSSTNELFEIFKIVKCIFLLSNHKLTERYLRPDIYKHVLGMLEFDESLPESKRIPHRKVIESQVKFNEVVSFEDAATLERIHLNYRLLYLKDIVLPRQLDDAAFASLVQLIHTNLSVILDQLQRSGQILVQLLEKVRQQDMQSLLFLQDACRLSRQIPPMQRQVLYDRMAEHGLFDALAVFFGEKSAADPGSDVTSDAGVRPPKDHPAAHHAVEVILLHAQCDPSHLRNFLTREDSEAGRAVLGALIQMIVTEDDQGVQGQIADTIRAIIDPSALEHREQDKRLDVFYERGAMDEIVAPLRSSDTSASSPQACFAQQLVCEILAFAIARHGYRAKVYVIRQSLAQQVSRLLNAPHRFLQLAAVRVIRAIVSTKDEAFHKYLTKNGLLAPLMKSFEQCLAPPALGINLLASATLDLLEFIRIENMKVLVEHLCKQHALLLQQYAPKLRTVELLLLKYQQNLEYEAYPPDQHAAGGPLDGSEGRPGQRRMRSPGRDDSGEDDGYFESLDDEGDEDPPAADGSDSRPPPEDDAPQGDQKAGLQGLLGGYEDEDEDAEAKRTVAADRNDEDDKENVPEGDAAEQTAEAAEAAGESGSALEETSADAQATSEKTLGHVSKRPRTSESSED